MLELLFFICLLCPGPLSLTPPTTNLSTRGRKTSPPTRTAQLTCRHAHQDHCALPDYVEFKPQQPVDLSSVLSAASPDAMDLLLQLLVLRPDKRATAREALRHPFFTKHEPKPCAPSELALPIPEERKHKVRLLCDGGSVLGGRRGKEHAVYR